MVGVTDQDAVDDDSSEDNEDEEETEGGGLQVMTTNTTCWGDRAALLRDHRRRLDSPPAGDQARRWSGLRGCRELGHEPRVPLGGEPGPPRTDGRLGRSGYRRTKRTARRPMAGRRERTADARQGNRRTCKHCLQTWTRCGKRTRRSGRRPERRQPPLVGHARRARKEVWLPMEHRRRLSHRAAGLADLYR